MNKNKNLNVAKKQKKDEFYTQYIDIEKEVVNYKTEFENKIVFCNCNDVDKNFHKYFLDNFDNLKLKELWVSENKENGRLLKYKRKDNKICEEILLLENGDFRSDECVELLKEADIVVTNPPFSLFREFVATLIKNEKKFLIIGHINATKYKEIFPLIKENKIWLGFGFKGMAGFFINKHYEDYATASTHKEGMIRVSGVHWFTNLDIDKRHEKIILYKNYKNNEKEYPKYDNYNYIEVIKTKYIPVDYNGVMGVPITFIDKYNPDQFEIIGMLNDAKLDGKIVYTRFLIRNKNFNNEK